MRRVAPLRAVASLTLAACVPCVAASSDAWAAEEPPAGAAAPEGEAGSPPRVDVSADQVDLTRDQNPAGVDAPAEPLEAPPPPPYKKTLVLDTSLGALVFLGKFGQVSPPGPWVHAQLGYEIWRWFMVFAEGELGFSTTGRAEPPPRTRAFPVFGFGGGVRFTARFTPRFGMYLQGSAGAMQVDVAQNAFTNLGYRDAERLGLYVGGRLGAEWYQVDRHFALGLSVGLRDATGFAKQTGAGNDLPLLLDAAASIRYAF